MSIGERIADLRKGHDLSQGQLANLMGVSRQAISKWENDQTSPDTLNLIKLAEVFESSIEYLATGEKKQAPVMFKEVIKEVEKPVEVEVEIPIIQKVEVEKIVEVERIVEVEKPIIRRRIRVQYKDHPLHMLALGTGCFFLGLLLGILF